MNFLERSSIMGRKQKLRQERKAAIAAEALQPDKKGGLFWIVLTGLCALMLYPPFFRGLFFSREFLPTHAFSALLFGLWWIYKLSVKKDASFLTHPLDYAVLGLVAAYAISLIPAVNTRAAIGELLKNSNYFIAFWLAAEMTGELKKPQFLLNILLANAVLVALLGIGAAAGTIDYPGAVISGRISSSLQYPNTLATYMMAAFFISTTLYLNCEHKWGRFIYPGTNFTLLLVLIFTYSRGAWLAFPVIMVLYLIGLSGGKRIGAVVLFVVTLVPALLCMQGFSSAITAGAQARVWLWYLAGAVLTIGLAQLNQFIVKHVSGINKKTAIAVAGAGIVVLAVLAGVLFSARQPIMLAHSADEEDSWKTVRREINDIKPDTDYTVVLDIDSKNPEEKQYSWRVVIQSINDKGEASSILTQAGSQTDGVETQELPFSTMPDTEKIRLIFYNYFANTHAVYDNINIYEGEDRSNPIPVMTSFKYIPENIVQRFSSISLKESGASSRFEFYRDALKIIKDYPILGAGGGGWQSLYQGYQSRLYWTTEVHSYFLQLWVETGTLGFAVLCGVCIILAFETFKLLRAKGTDASGRNCTWAAFVGAFAIGAHSVIDFNLSLGAVALFLWFLIGIVRGGMSYIKEDSETTIKPKKHGSTVAARYYAFTMLPVILIVAASLSLLAGEVMAGKAGGYLGEGYLTEALAAYDSATRFDPFKSEYRVAKAQVLDIMGRHTEDASYIQRAGMEYEKAIKYDGHSAKNHSAVGFYYLTVGQAEKGFEHIEKAVQLHPYNIDYYEQKAYAYKELIEYMIENRNPDGAMEYIQKTLGIAEDMRFLNEKSSQPIEMTHRLLTDLEKLAFMGSEADNRRIHRIANRIVFATTQMFNTNGDHIPDFWRIGNSEGGSIDTQIIEEKGERVLRIENKGNGLGYIYTRDFALQPDEWYLLTFKARGEIDPKNFRIYIRSRSGESTQGSITSIKVSEEWQEYELEVLTTADIEPGNQYIRIDHRGNDTGYFEIKDIILREW
jgi:O-antigen ligase